jgi:hypothetical protein
VSKILSQLFQQSLKDLEHEFVETLESGFGKRLGHLQTGLQGLETQFEILRRALLDEEGPNVPRQFWMELTKEQLNVHRGTDAPTNEKGSGSGDAGETAMLDSEE